MVLPKRVSESKKDSIASTKQLKSKKNESGLKRSLFFRLTLSITSGNKTLAVEFIIKGEII